MHLFHCVSSVYADSLRWDFGKNGSTMFGYQEALPGDFVSQPLPFFAEETEHPAASLLGPRRVVT
jgi:hypothetical protein